MISGTTSCFPNVPQGLQQINMYGGVAEDVVVSSDTDTNTNSLLYSLSVLKEKVHQVQSLVTIFISPHKTQPAESTAIATASMSTLIQEIIVTASSMMFTCQQMSLPTTSGNNELFDWYGDHNYNTNCNNTISNNINEMERTELRRRGESSEGISRMSNDIIELDAADILAKYTHYCQVCGKGFKRDANLRMHMRAHGDEYKSSSALSNPMKKNKLQPRKYYSCPQEGCRWNRKHHKFQPLKSMICVKNHYKRSHCPKMYVCKRCNRKHFSVLSDLRTHEKHCGLIKWQCSCGTTFSRKDKLMGHVALFAGHMPAINSSTKIGKVEQFATQMRPD